MKRYVILMAIGVTLLCSSTRLFAGMLPVISNTQQSIVLENEYFKLAVSPGDGMRVDQFITKHDSRNVIAVPGKSRLLSIRHNGKLINKFKIDKLNISGKGKEKFLNITLIPEVLDAVSLDMRLIIDDKACINATLAINNRLDKNIELEEIFFPLLGGVKVGNNINDNSYFYPRGGGIINNAPAKLISTRRFPIPFVQIMDIYNPVDNVGMYLMTKDTHHTYKYYTLEKSSRDMSMGVSYAKQIIGSNSRIEFAPVAIGLHKGGWQKALDEYRSWASTWYKPISPRLSKFKEIFEVIRTEGYVYNGLEPLSPGIFKTIEEKYGLNKHTLVDSDSHAWGAGNVGDYRTAESIDVFKRKINSVRDKDALWGVYMSPPIVTMNSQLFKSNKALVDDGQAWGANGKPMQIYDSGSKLNYALMCLHNDAYQDYLAKCAARIISESDADGIYLDLLGYAPEHYRCWNASHGHPVPSNVLDDQCALISKIRKAVNKVKPGVFLYSEYKGSDNFSQYVDGIVTFYNPLEDEEKLSPSNVDLNRFLFPDIKHIAMFNLNEIKGKGDPLKYIKRVFFNGEGVWYSRRIADERVIAYINKMTSIMSKNVDAFTSLSPVPLVKTEAAGIYANKFPGQNKTVYTLYNSRNSIISGKVLNIGSVSKHKRVVDLWNNVEIAPLTVNGQCYLELDIAPYDVRCIALYD